MRLFLRDGEDADGVAARLALRELHLASEHAAHERLLVLADDREARRHARRGAVALDERLAVRRGLDRRHEAVLRLMRGERFELRLARELALEVLHEVLFPAREDLPQ